MQDASGNLSNHYNFFRPEILDIRPITIYRDNEAELKRKRNAERLEKLKIDKEEREKIDKIISEQEATRERIKSIAYKEFQVQQNKQQEDIKKIIELANIKTQKELMKTKFSTNNIEENMSDLLGSLKSNIEEVSDYSDSSDDIESQKSSKELSIHSVELLITDASQNIVV